MARLRTILVVTLLVSAGACGSKRPTEPTPPPAALAITCPASAEAESLDGNPVTVTVPPPRVENGVAPVTTSCSAAAGAAFSVGTTAVSCQATDGAGRSATCRFTVSVRPPPRLTYTQYLSFGDSLTEGVISLGPTLLALDSPQSYPSVLRGLLRSRYQTQTPDVINAGNAGELASGEGLSRFRPVLLTSRPEVVLLMEGTNDLLSREPGATRALAALDAMMREAESQNVRVCLATIPPQRAGGLRHRDAVVALIPGFNDQVRALAARHGAVLVDVYAAMKDNLSLIGLDDLHPTPLGYQVMAQTYFDALKAAFEVQGATGGFRQAR